MGGDRETGTEREREENRKENKQKEKKEEDKRTVLFIILVYHSRKKMFFIPDKFGVRCQELSLFRPNLIPKTPSTVTEIN
jgi:hypothetical protein